MENNEDILNAGQQFLSDLTDAEKLEWAEETISDYREKIKKLNQQMDDANDIIRFIDKQCKGYVYEQGSLMDKKMVELHQKLQR